MSRNLNNGDRNILTQKNDKNETSEKIIKISCIKTVVLKMQNYLFLFNNYYFEVLK